MRIQATVTRPHYYDRNPLWRGAAYEASGVAPHVATVRQSYTVPAGRRAYIEAVFAKAVRNTVSAPAGEVRATVVFTPFGMPDQIVAEASFTSQDVGWAHQDSLAPVGLMLPGDIIVLRTSDASTGGTVTYRMAMKLFEFDA